MLKRTTATTWLASTSQYLQLHMQHVVQKNNGGTFVKQNYLFDIAHVSVSPWHSRVVKGQTAAYRGNEEVCGGQVARLKEKKMPNASFFSFSFPLNHKMLPNSPLTLTCVWHRSGCDTSVSAFVVKLQLSAFALMPPPPPHTHTHTREGRMKTACQICQFKTDRMGLESFPFKSDFSFNLSRWCNVEKLIESTTDRKHNSMFFSWISLSLQLTWCNETNLSQNISLLTYLFISLQSCFLHKKKHFSLFCAEVYHNSGNFAFTRRQRLDWWTHIFVVLIY